MPLISDVDTTKARLWLKYVARSNRKRLMRTQALKKLHEEIKQLKKVSSKATRGHITKFEKRIVETLKEGGFIKECEEPAVPAQPAAEAEVPMQQNELAVEISGQETVAEISATVELSREERLKQVEDEARARAVPETPEVPVAELKKVLNRLEAVRKKIKVSNADDKERLKGIVARITALKEKMSESAPREKPRTKQHKKKVKAKKKTSSR